MARRIKCPHCHRTFSPPSPAYLKKGGKARAAALTPDQRRRIAQQAAAARWHRSDESA